MLTRLMPLSKQHLSLFLTVPMIFLPLGCDRSRSLTNSEGNQATITQSGDSTEISIEKSDGSEVQTSLGGDGIPLPKDLPKDLPILANASVVSTSVSPEGTAVVLETTTELEAVIEFYEGEIQAQDWQMTDTIRVPEGVVFIANKDEQRNLSVLISEHHGDGASLITLTIDTVDTSEN